MSTDAVDRQMNILRERAMQATWAVVSGIGTAELLFASFAIGASLGPAPLRPLEILILSTFVFIGGGVASLWLMRKRQEREAKLMIELVEGSRRRRVVVFSDYFTLAGEVVLKSAIASTEIDDRGLVLRYRDPRFEGPVLRELTGPADALDRLKNELVAQTPSGN